MDNQGERKYSCGDRKTHGAVVTPAFLACQLLAATTVLREHSLREVPIPC
jgi:hypothetical protein